MRNLILATAALSAALSPAAYRYTAWPETMPGNTASPFILAKPFADLAEAVRQRRTIVEYALPPGVVSQPYLSSNRPHGYIDDVALPTITNSPWIVSAGQYDRNTNLYTFAAASSVTNTALPDGSSGESVVHDLRLLASGPQAFPIFPNRFKSNAWYVPTSFSLDAQARRVGNKHYGSLIAAINDLFDVDLFLYTQPEANEGSFILQSHIDLAQTNCCKLSKIAVTLPVSANEIGNLPIWGDGPYSNFNQSFSEVADLGKMSWEYGPVLKQPVWTTDVEYLSGPESRRKYTPSPGSGLFSMDLKVSKTGYEYEDDQGDMQLAVTPNPRFRGSYHSEIPDQELNLPIFTTNTLYAIDGREKIELSEAICIWKAQESANCEKTTADLSAINTIYHLTTNFYFISTNSIMPELAGCYNGLYRQSYPAYTNRCRWTCSAYTLQAAWNDVASTIPIPAEAVAYMPQRQVYTKEGDAWSCNIPYTLDAPTVAGESYWRRASLIRLELIALVLLFNLTAE